MNGIFAELPKVICYKCGDEMEIKEWEVADEQLKVFSNSGEIYTGVIPYRDRDYLCNNCQYWWPANNRIVYVGATNTLIWDPF